MLRWKQGFFTLLALVFVLGTNAEAFFGNDDNKRFQDKSGIIDYNITGSNVSGKQRMIWDNWGQNSYTEGTTNTSFMGFNNTTTTRDYIEGDFSYSYDPQTNELVRMNIEEFMQGGSGDGKEGRSYNYSEDMIIKMGGVLIGTDTILGHKVKIYEIAAYGMKIWVWEDRGVPLKTVVNMMGFSFVSEAVNIQTNVRIDPKQIALPAGATIVDAPEVVQNMDANDIQNAMGQFGDAMNAYKNNPEYQQQQQAIQQAQQQWQQQQQQVNTQQQNPTTAAGNFAQQTVDGAQKGAANATKREVKNAASNAATQGTRKVMNSIIGGIFGN